MLAASTSVCSTGCFMQIWVVNSTINSRGFRTSVHFSLFYRVDSVSDHCMMFPTCLKLESSWERSSLERRSMWVWTMSNLLRTLFPRKLAVNVQLLAKTLSQLSSFSSLLCITFSCSNKWSPHKQRSSSTCLWHRTSAAMGWSLELRTGMETEEVDKNI